MQRPTLINEQSSLRCSVNHAGQPSRIGVEREETSTGDWLQPAVIDTRAHTAL